MPSETLLIRPRDTLIARDARPFTADPGARATTLPWPLPSTLAGALRTHIGNARNFDWGRDGPDRARRIGIHGPLLAASRGAGNGWTVYVQQPRDALLTGDSANPAATRLLPTALQSGEGTNLPPGLLPLEITTEDKPQEAIAFWSLADVQAWLAAPSGGNPPREWLPALSRQTETHVSIDPTTGLNATGALFATTGLVFDRPPAADGDGRTEFAMLCRVIDSEGWSAGVGLLPVGGERRLARLLPKPDAWPTPGDPLRAALAGAGRLRLLLATPALFAGGWRPGWLAEDLRGTPPGVPDLRLRLVAVAGGRRVPVSGWDYQRDAPKPVRYAAPAGSVYFFEIEGNRPPSEWIDRLWLAPLSDDEQDRRDGFGLALPGVW